MNRLSEYITGMKLTRQLLGEAKIRQTEGKDGKALAYLIQAFDAYVSAQNCIVSIRSGRKPKNRGR